MTEFNNASDLEFIDISTERRRVYEFAGGTVEIREPKRLHVSANGHRLIDGAGVSHYVPLGWIHLWWETHDNQPHFVA